MIVVRMFWFRRGLDKFVADVNDIARRGGMKLASLSFQRGTFGLRWLASAVFEVSMDPLPSKS